MEHVTPHQVLVYLVEVSDDSDRAWRLQVGQQLLDLARDEGKLSREDRARDDAFFAQRMFALKDSGSVGFTEWPGYERPPIGRFLEGSHIANVTDIYVTSAGRLAVQGSAIQSLVASLTSDVARFLDALDVRIDETSATPEEKAEAHGALRDARELATSTAGSVIGAALSAHLKALGF